MFGFVPIFVGFVVSSRTDFLSFCIPKNAYDKIHSGNYIERRNLNYSLLHTSIDDIIHHTANSFHIDGGPINTRVWSIGKKFSNWVFFGFPGGQTTFLLVHTIYVVLLEALMPIMGKSAKTSKHGWAIVCHISHILALFDLVRWNCKHKWMRVVLRSFGTEIRKAILTKDLAHEHWRSFLSLGVLAVFQPSMIPAETANYFAGCAHQKKWYTGEANLARLVELSGGKKFWMSGVPSRFKEHVIGTRYVGNHALLEIRYRHWKNSAPGDSSFLEFARGPEQLCLVFEAHVIYRLQAPIQAWIRLSAFRVSKFRDHARFRKTLDTKDELGLNFADCFRKRVGKYKNDLFELHGIEDFKSLCEWQLLVFHWLCFMLELLRLQWPFSMICKNILSLPRRHRSSFISFVRVFARKLLWQCGSVEDLLDLVRTAPQGGYSDSFVEYFGDMGKGSKKGDKRNDHTQQGSIKGGWQNSNNTWPSQSSNSSNWDSVSIWNTGAMWQNPLFEKAQQVVEREEAAAQAKQWRQEAKAAVKWVIDEAWSTSGGGEQSTRRSPSLQQLLSH